MGVDRSTARDGRQGELLAQLMAGISALTDSAPWQRYLDCQSRFHRYSFGNVLLIAAQRPDATRVAGYAAWQKLDRKVRQGEKAIWILAPVIVRGAEDEDARPAVRGFRHVAVFDVGQTEGAELPAVCHRLHGDDADGCLAELIAQANSLGFSVELAPLDSGVNGDCSFELRRIRVERRNEPRQQVKTLAHELSHALLHAEQPDRAVAELEAESTAYVVCRSLGIDSGDYSFGYVAMWSGGGEQALAGIRASGERIQRTAAAILARFDEVTAQPTASAA